MECPDGMYWIPDREYCSKCPPGQVYNAQWNECQNMDRSVINPGMYPTASAALFGLDDVTSFQPKYLALSVVSAVAALGQAYAINTFLERKEIIKKRPIAKVSLLQLAKEPQTGILLTMLGLSMFAFRPFFD